MAYTVFDRFVAWLRFRAAARHIGSGSCVCDIGCGSGAPFLHYIAPRLESGVGLDEHISLPRNPKNSLIRADITKDFPLASEQFDHVVMLAVLEHVTQPESVLAEAHRILRPGGSLILTWPTAMVDPILKVLTNLKFVSDDLGFEQHKPRIPTAKLKATLRGIGFAMIENGRFECGLNNWMVARKET